MRAAVVYGAGSAPIYGEFAEPVATAGEIVVAVRAAALSQLARARASGTHYSSDDVFPFVPGVDGVGETVDGSRVYFMLPRSPHGAMAERTAVATAHTLAIPRSLDDVTAAAIANPGMSSWAALRERARLVAGETVLVNGATGASGRLAVQIARHLGAGRVVATGRDPGALASLGADAVVRLDGEERFEPVFAAGVDVVVDYLWGGSAGRILAAAARAGIADRALRFVQVGTASGRTIALPGALLRSGGISLMGSGLGSVPTHRLLEGIAGVFEAAAAGRLSIAAAAVSLAEVGPAWSRGGERIVFTMGPSGSPTGEAPGEVPGETR